MLSAYVLLEQSPGAEQFVAQLKSCLNAQLHQRSSMDVDLTLNKLMEVLPYLRELAIRHQNCWSRFRKQMCELKTEEGADNEQRQAAIMESFPPLYIELFAANTE